MNRKVKRKSKKLYKSPAQTSQEFSGLLKIFIGVVAVFLIVYLASAIYHGEVFKEDDPEDEIVAPEFQDTEILAGSTFVNDKDEYMVLYYSFDSDYATMLDVLRDGYASENEIKTYTVDLDKGFNKPYVIENEKELNLKPKNASELKVVDYTLIRIKKGKVVKFITGIDAIRDYINSLSTTK